MLKKISVFFLLCVSIAAFSACSDSGSDQIVFVSPTIEGTYDVTYFGTATSPLPGFDLVITDSCSKSKELKVLDINNPKQQCSQTSTMKGEIVITRNEDKTLSITSKLQMAGGMVEMSSTDKFQYTQYYAVVPAENNLSGVGVGMTGYNLDETTGELSTTPVEFADSPFEFYLTGSELIIKMTLKGKVTIMGTIDAPTVVKAKKRSDAVATLDKIRFWNFNVDSVMKGAYKIDLFASETNGKVITNDCGAAIASGFANIYNCGVGTNQATKFEGVLAVNVDPEDSLALNMAQIFVKVQMNGGLVDSVPAEKYMYITYPAVPGTMTAKGIQELNFLDATTNLPSNNAITYDKLTDSTSKISMSEDKKVMTIETVISRELDVDGVMKKVDTKTIIKATRTSDVYEYLSEDLLYTF